MSLWRTLPWDWSCRGPGSGLLSQKSHTDAYICRGLWVLPTPGDSRLMPGPAGVLAQVYSLEVPRLTSGPSEVSGSCLHPNRSQTHAWTHRDLWLWPSPSVLVPMEFDVSSLLWPRSLPQVCSSLGRWPSPASRDVPSIDPFLLLWNSLSQANSGLGYWLSPAPVKFYRPRPAQAQVAGSVLLLWIPLPHAFSKCFSWSHRLNA